MPLNLVSLRETFDGVLVLSQIHVTEALVVPNFPVVWRDLLSLALILLLAVKAMAMLRVFSYI